MVFIIWNLIAESGISGPGWLHSIVDKQYLIRESMRVMWTWLDHQNPYPFWQYRSAVSYCSATLPYTID